MLWAVRPVPAKNAHPQRALQRQRLRKLVGQSGGDRAKSAAQSSEEEQGPQSARMVLYTFQKKCMIEKIESVSCRGGRLQKLNVVFFCQA